MTATLYEGCVIRPFVFSGDGQTYHKGDTFKASEEDIKRIELKGFVSDVKAVQAPKRQTKKTV